MSEPITYVGIDAHKVELHVALLAPDASAPVTWKVQNEARAVDRLRRKLEKAAPGPVACCYEAGPCGYALQRQLERGRVQCQVIAPALVPRKPGERIKTDRRDARKLAELHRAGLLTEVRPPTPAEEAVRDLCRARDDARADRQRCRHRLGKLLLRRGLHYPGRAWTQAHRRWVNGLTWPHPADRVVVDDYLLAVRANPITRITAEGASPASTRCTACMRMSSSALWSSERPSRFLTLSIIQCQVTYFQLNNRVIAMALCPEVALPPLRDPLILPYGINKTKPLLNRGCTTSL